MPLFKKSSLDPGLLSDRYVKVLQRCRMLLVKDADAPLILDVLGSEDGFKSDTKDTILAQPTQQQRMALLLDRLEGRGDKAFGLFMDALKDNYRHIHSVLEETLRHIHDLDEGGHRDRTSMPGDVVRKLVRSTSAHGKTDRYQGSESGDELEMDLEEKEDFYLDCYSIPLKGRQCRESWIKHETDSIHIAGTDTEQDDATYMATLVKNTVFKKVDFKDIPQNVKKPGTRHCQIYVMDTDQKTPIGITLKPEIKPEVPARGKMFNTRKTSHNLDKPIFTPESKPKVVDAPPPVPPKPDHLPPLSPRPPVLRMRPSTRKKKKSKEKPALPPKPDFPLRRGSRDAVDNEAGNNVNMEDEDTESSTEEDESTEEEQSPVLPPRTVKPVRDENDKSDQISTSSSKSFNSRPLSLVAEEGIVIINKDSNGNINGEIIEEKGMNGSIPEVVINSDEVVNFDDIEQESYEPITGRDIEDRNGDTAEDSVGLECQIPIGSIQDDLDAPNGEDMDDDDDDDDDDDNDDEDNKENVDGKEKAHEEPITPTDSKKSEESLNETSSPSSSVESQSNVTLESQSSVSDVTDTQSISTLVPENVLLPSRRGSKKEKPKPPHLLPRSSISDQGIPMMDRDNSSGDDSYYEDIESMDTLMDASPSPTSPTSYLDPKSYARALEHAISSAAGNQRDTKLAAQHFSFETTDRCMLKKGELIIVESELCCQADAVSSDNVDNALYNDTVMAYDKLGRLFYIPENLLKKYGDPEGEPWFYPIEITSRQAALFLSQVKQEGCFVVYRPLNKTSGAVFNLSVDRGKGDVVHYHIMRNIHGDVMLEKHDQSFMNVSELVTYFQRNKSRLATRLRRPLKEAHLPITPGYHYPAKWEIQRTSLSLTGSIIGKGQFGVVCAGIYKRYPVAVKVMQKSEAKLTEEDDFIDEARMLMGLRHEHVVRLVGITCTAKPFFLVTEYVSRGNLRDCLRNEAMKIDIDTLFDFCIQVTSAMYYLETRRFLLHRDLAARNCLVTDDMCVKVADFGRAVYVTDDNYIAPKTEKIAIKWAAPEVLTDSVYSTKSDVWSLGVLYWEVFSSGTRPYYSLTAEQTAVYVTEGGRLEKPPGCAADLYAIMNSCWRSYPEQRPSFTALYERMKSKSSIYYGPVRPKSGTSDAGSVKTSDTVSIKSKISTPAVPKKSPTRKTPSIVNKPTDELARELLDNLREQHLDPNTRGSKERLATSSSETSLISAVGLGQGKDDLSRGDKIRKSLRKIMNSKAKRKTSSVSQGKPENNNRDAKTLPTGGQYFV